MFLHNGQRLTKVLVLTWLYILFLFIKMKEINSLVFIILMREFTPTPHKQHFNQSLLHLIQNIHFLLCSTFMKNQSKRRNSERGSERGISTGPAIRVNSLRLVESQGYILFLSILWHKSGSIVFLNLFMEGRRVKIEIEREWQHSGLMPRGTTNP